MRPLFLTFFLFTCAVLKGQSDCNQRTTKVYQDIIESIGNKFPPAPTLEFSDSERAVAFISGSEIIIENKIISSLCSQDNFEDKISYIIAHELAHHYLNHNWMTNTGLSYASTIGDYLEDQAYTKNQRKIAETQADLYAGFFGQVSGYNTLGYAKETLTHVYNLYGLKKNINGYPSFDERIEIIQTKEAEANEIVVLFEIANAFLMLKEYYLAEKCFLEIKNNFNSREIYNNLALTYLLKAISIDEKLAKFNYPIHLDLETRANTNKTRSNLSNDFSSLIKEAEKNINLSLSLDPNYLKAKRNQIVLEFVKQKQKGIENVAEKEIFNDLENTLKTDLKVIEMLIEGKKLKKIEKEALSGSSVSLSNIKEITTQKDQTAGVIKILNIDESNFIFGFPNTKKIKSVRGNLEIRLFKETNYEVFSVGDTYLIRTKKELSPPGLKINQSYYYLKK